MWDAITEETLNNKLKCRFCEYTTSRWSTTRGKKRKSGMVRLIKHVDEAHPDEAKKILEFSGNYEERSLTDAHFSCR